MVKQEMYAPTHSIVGADMLLNQPGIRSMSLHDQLILAEVELLQSDMLMLQFGAKTPEQVQHHKNLQEDIHGIKVDILDEAREVLVQREAELDGTSQDSIQAYIDALRNSAAAEDSIGHLQNKESAESLNMHAATMEENLKAGLESGDIKPSVEKVIEFANNGDVDLIEPEEIAPSQDLETQMEMAIEEYLELNPALLNLPPHILETHLQTFLDEEFKVEEFSEPTTSEMEAEILALEQEEIMLQEELQLLIAEQQHLSVYAQPEEYIAMIEEGHIYDPTMQSDFSIGETKVIADSFGMAANGDSFDTIDSQQPMLGLKVGENDFSYEGPSGMG